jgi:hypothetical protein
MMLVPSMMTTMCVPASTGKSAEQNYELRELNEGSASETKISLIRVICSFYSCPIVFHWIVCNFVVSLCRRLPAWAAPGYDAPWPHRIRVANRPLQTRKESFK